MINGKRQYSGFTLIELLVVMVIVASLLTIAVPRYFKSLDHSKEVVLMQDLAVMRDAIDQFHEDRGRYPLEIGELVDERYIRKVPVDPMTRSADTWIAVPHEDDLVEGIYDIRSGAEGKTSTGVPFGEL